MSRRIPPTRMTDSDVDALLVASHRDRELDDADASVDTLDVGEDDEAAYQRFLGRPLLKNATTGEYELADGDSVGASVGEYVRWGTCEAPPSRKDNQ